MSRPPTLGSTRRAGTTSGLVTFEYELRERVVVARSHPLHDEAQQERQQVEICQRLDEEDQRALHRQSLLGRCREDRHAMTPTRRACRKSPCRCGRASRRRRSLRRSRPTFPSTTCRARCRRVRAARAARRVRRTIRAGAPRCGGSVMRPRSLSRGSLEIAARARQPPSTRRRPLRLVALIDLN